MSPTRRDFLKISAGGALAANALGAERLSGAPAGPDPVRPADRWGARMVQEAPRRLNILILGGTGFIGPFQVRSALDRGHNVTLFERDDTGAGRRVASGTRTLRPPKHLHPADIEELTE